MKKLTPAQIDALLKATDPANVQEIQQIMARWRALQPQLELARQKLHDGLTQRLAYDERRKARKRKESDNGKDY